MNEAHKTFDSTARLLLAFFRRFIFRVLRTRNAKLVELGFLELFDRLRSDCISNGYDLRLGVVKSSLKSKIIFGGSWKRLFESVNWIRLFEKVYF